MLNKNKVVVITGASAGIGAALAELVARKGSHPVLAARREPELRAVAVRCEQDPLTVVADVTRRAEVEQIRDAALARFGHIDVWVNNAGRGISRPVSLLSEEDFDEIMSVNVKSALYGMQTMLPHFMAHGHGQIINVSSLLGRLPLVPERSAYSAAKAALNSLTANLRMELREQFPSIHICTVLPGPVATEFGVSALGGGMDSRRISGAQSAEEVAAVIWDVIENPRPDVYTRPGLREHVAEYYAAEDMQAHEDRIVLRAPPTK
jgi:NAD(P)-dependent dehydrogenase (short-subunit alcohol dehydrogenase family)